MKTDLVDEPANDARSLFPGIRLGEAIPKATNLVDIVTGDVGVNADRVRRWRRELDLDLIQLSLTLFQSIKQGRTYPTGGNGIDKVPNLCFQRGPAPIRFGMGGRGLRSNTIDLLGVFPDEDVRQLWCQEPVLQAVQHGIFGYCESFNARFRDELLNGEIFYTLKEAQIIIEEWRKHYNTKRPHSALGYRPPAPETVVPMATRPVMH